MGNHFIRRIAIPTGAVTTLAGTGGSAGSADGQGTTASFNYPYGVTMNAAGTFALVVRAARGVGQSNRLSVTGALCLTPPF